MVEVLRKSEGECPHRLQPPPGTRTCYHFAEKYYVLEPQTEEFQVARQQCENMGGVLVEIGPEEPEEEQHFLASIVPPDGAWIGLQPVNKQWLWISSKRKVSLNTCCSQVH